MNPNCRCFGTVNAIGFSRGLLNRQFWMPVILQQFCAGDEDSSEEEEEEQAPEAEESGNVL